MDSFKHVNNTVYFKYQETSRMHFFEEFLKEIDDKLFDKQAFNEGTGIAPILSTTSCTFKFPVSYPDNLLVGALIKPEDLSQDRFKISHQIWSLRHSRIVSDGSGTVVCFNYATQKVENLPTVLNDAIRKVSGRDSLSMLSSIDRSPEI